MKHTEIAAELDSLANEISQKFDFTTKSHRRLVALIRAASIVREARDESERGTDSESGLDSNPPPVL